MTKKTVFNCLAIVLVLAGVMFGGRQYYLNSKAVPEPTPKPVVEEPKKTPIEIKIEGTPISEINKQPQVEVTTDANGDQDIKPIIDPVPAPKVEQPKEPVATIKPEPVVEPKAEVKTEPKAEPKPEPKPVVKPEVKPQPKPTEKPKSTGAKDGDTRVVNGQNQVYLDGFGWVDNRPGGESIYVDVNPSGELIGQ